VSVRQGSPPLAAIAAGLALVIGAAVTAGAEPCPRCLRAGAATTALTVPAGTPLAGYGSAPRRLIIPGLFGRYPHAFWFRPHEGRLDGIGARALVVEGDGTRLVWIAADLIAVDRSLTEAVTARLQRPDGSRPVVILSASHTHSGPGAFMESRLMGLVATDRPDPDVRAALVQALVDLARRAEARAVPARIGAVTVEAPAVVVGRLGESPDPEMVVMKVASAEGTPIAMVWNFAIHGTMLPPHNLAISGDVMGLAARELEGNLGVPALFVNGAVADVSPKDHGHPAAVATADALARAARTAWSRIEARDEHPPAVRTTRVFLGSPMLSLKNCVGRWVPRAARVPLGFALPAEATLTAAAAGDAVWVTIPGELQSRLGTAVKRKARAWFRDPFVAGVSNDYLGYFVAPDQYDRSTYVTCANLYGPDAGERLARAAAGLVQELGTDRAQRVQR
jgi:neutral/alkaline ceramidase-like enzyme